MRNFQCHGVGPVRFECSAQRLAVLLLVALSLFMFSDAALAQTIDVLAGESLANALNNLVATLNGSIARSLAIIAVIGMGVAALTGRVEWSRAVVVILGVGLIFSATAIIEGLFGIAPAASGK